MNIARVITIFIAQGIVLFIFILMMYNINKNKETRSLQRDFFTSYYLIGSIGLIINFIYILIAIELVTTLLYKLCIFCIYLSPLFITLALTLYLNEENEIENKKIIINFSLYVIALFGIFLIPDGVVMNESTDWYPLPSLFFMLYTNIVLTIQFSLFFFNAYKLLKIERLKDNPKMKRKWIFIMLGITFIYIFCVITMLVHYLNIYSLRTIWSVIGFIILVTSSYLTYTGIQKKLKKK